MKTDFSSHTILSIFILLALLLNSALISFATEITPDTYRVTHINISNGLPHNFVDDIYRDSKGFVWISLGGAGLVRHDGYGFIQYSPISTNRNIPGNFVKNVVEDDHSRLWVATDNGLAIIDLSTLKPIDIISLDKRFEKYKATSINSVSIDSKHRVWIRYNNGIECISFEASGNPMHLYEFKDGGQSVYNSSALVDVNSDGRMWTVVNGDVCKLNTKGKDEIQIETLHIKLPEGALVNDFLADGSVVWIATDKGLLRHTRNLSQDKLFTHSPTDYTSISQDLVTALAMRADGHLIASTLNGLNIYDTETESFAHVYASNSGDNLNSNFVNSLLVDDDMLWVGTETGGVNIFTAKAIPSHFEGHRAQDPGSLPSNPVNALYEDSEGTLWVGVVEGGLNSRKRNDSAFQHFTTGNSALSHNSVSTIAQDTKGNLWVGTWGGGLDVIAADNPSKSVMHMLDFGDFGQKPYIGCLIRDPYNIGMWIGTSNGMLFYDENQKKLIEPFENGGYLPRGCIGAVIDRDNHLWIGGMYGLYDIDLASRKQEGWDYRFLSSKLDAPGSQLREKISYLYYDSKGVLWIGSDIHGLYRRDFDADGNEIFINITTDDGLPSNTIMGIAEDNRHRLWISTNKGLSCFTPAENRFVNYTKEHGLNTDQFYWNAALSTHNGKLIFGAVDGMLTIDPTDISQSESNHKVVFTHLYVDNELIFDDQDISPYDISMADKITLHERNKSFSIEFSALDYTLDPTCHYSYKLEGFDKDWIPLPEGRNFVTYTNIHPGKYRLLVSYNAVGESHPNVVSGIDIEIKQYFYHTTWFVMLMILLCAGIIYALFRYRLQSIKEKKAELETAVAERTEKISMQKQILEERTMRIQELTVERLSFFTNLTHEFRTPITLILGPVHHALQLCKETAVAEQLQYVERNAKYLLNLVNQLMDFRKIESGKMEIVRKKSNFLDFLHQFVETFLPAAAERNIRIVVHVHMSKSEICFDKEAVRKLLTNLIGNALKYTPDNGEITLYAVLLPQSCTNSHFDSLYLCVSDTGDGIDPDDLDHVFDQFFQGKSYLKFPNMQASSGIGLHLCKCIVEAYGGTISVKNNPKRGCRFRITIPIPSVDDEKSALASLPELNNDDEADAKASSRLKLLLIEDNADMRGYIKSLLSDSYDVIEAENGEEAIRLLATADVDFIICDLMMPVMDGMEFTKKAKENFSTSHIPIIMLTAKASDETRMESYRCGADAYVSKPFDADMLIARIENILKNKRRHQRQFSVDFDTSQLGIEESRDKKFLDMVMNVLKENYKNSYFDVGDFAEALGVSRSVLNKKLQSLVGQSSNEFVRNYRLKLAHQMIVQNRQTRSLNISEIAYDVGFNDSKYFTRCFTKYFGITPSTLLNG